MHRKFTNLKPHIKIVFIFLLFFTNHLQALDVPELQTRITDLTETLSKKTIEELDAKLEQHEEKTGNQIAVLIQNSLGDETLEEYSIKVATAWQLGQKGKDNGVLLLIAKQDRVLRIEVGYGLEGALPDAICNLIIRKVITPKFKEGDFDGGVKEGIDVILKYLNKEFTDESGLLSKEEIERMNYVHFFRKTPIIKDLITRFEPLNIYVGMMEDTAKEEPLPLWAKISFGAFIFGILGVFTTLAIFLKGFGWFLYFFLIPFWTIFPLFPLQQFAFIPLFLFLFVVFPYKVLYRFFPSLKKFHDRHGGSSSGRRSGSSWRSGGFSSSRSSGGFRGGGGSFGGGGSSGSW